MCIRDSVSTPHFEITDLGTSFTVSSYSNTDEVSATLKTGKIELRIIGQEDKAVSYTHLSLAYT